MARKKSMEMEDVIKYAAIGAAAWFGYRWAVGQGMIPDYLGIAADAVPATQPQYPQTAYPQPAQQQPAPAPANGAANDAGQGTGSNAAAGGTGGAGGNVKDQVWNAAKSEANANGGRLHFWQWNYYLPSNLSPVDPFAVPDALWAATSLGHKPVDAGEVQSTPLTIDQWWAMVKDPMGLGGWFQGMGTVNHWGQQSSMWPQGTV